jgi:N utilization substance protein A
VKHAGILADFDLNKEEAEALIMQARIKAGWVKEEDLAPPPAPEAPAEASEAQAEA